MGLIQLICWQSATKVNKKNIEKLKSRSHEDLDMLRKETQFPKTRSANTTPTKRGKKPQDIVSGHRRHSDKGRKARIQAKRPPSDKNK